MLDYGTLIINKAALSSVVVGAKVTVQTLICMINRRVTHLNVWKTAAAATTLRPRTTTRLTDHQAMAIDEQLSFYVSSFFSCLEYSLMFHKFCLFGRLLHLTVLTAAGGIRRSILIS